MINEVIKTKGIIIAESKEKEYDKLLTILTFDFGKIKVWANGCRKPTSKNIGKTKLFVYADFELKYSKYGYTLSYIEPLEYFDEIILDQDNAFYGFYFLEVVDYICKDFMESNEIIKLLYCSLKALLNKKIDNKLVRRIFEVKTLQYNGTYSDINNVPVNCRFTWNYIIDKSPELLYNFKLSEDLFNEFSNFIEKEFSKYIEKKFNSRRYLQ